MVKGHRPQQTQSCILTLPTGQLGSQNCVLIPERPDIFFFLKLERPDILTAPSMPIPSRRHMGSGKEEAGDLGPNVKIEEGGGCRG